MNIAEASLAHRFHHQWLPDKIFYEKGLSVDTLKILESMGHVLETSGTIGNTETILIDSKVFYGFADTRRIDGKATGE